MELIGICLITKDVLRLAEFYSTVLCVVPEGNSTHMDLRNDGADMAIFSVEGMESMAPGSMCGAGYGSFTISFEVKDPDAEYEKLKALGVEFIMPPTTHPWGARSTWFRDPDGNIVNFVCRAASNTI
ncbi:MAG: VOC family protein [Bacillota bacterium]|nr:VOC family protein [Bacillota bacterium]